MNRLLPRPARLALVLLLGAMILPALRAQDAEGWRSAVSEAKARLDQPGGADYEKVIGAALPKLPFNDAVRDCLRRHVGKLPREVNVVLVVSIDGSVRDVLRPPDDSISHCVAGWMNGQKGLPLPPRDAWMVHLQVKLQP